MKAIYLGENEHALERVYRPEIAARIASRFEIVEAPFTAASLGDGCDAEAVFSTWGMPALSEEEIARKLPRLKAVFYAAGSVQAFARPFLARGVRVFSAWRANAVPVVEYAVSQILLANKGFYQLPARTRTGWREAAAHFAHYKGNYRARVGILGDGAIGMQVILELLRHDLDVSVFSVTMTEERANELGVRLAGLEEIFSSCDVVSNHLANNAETRGIIDAHLLGLLRDYATLINTGRGAQIDENALCDVLAANPTLTAVLDVTDPEPPAEGSRLYSLPNCFLTPHIAGSAGNEVVRMAEYMAEEAERFLEGKPVRYEVTEDMLRTMA